MYSLDTWRQMETFFALALAGVFVYWQVAPEITASMGATLDLQKLIVYPINRDKLFFAEVALRLFTVGEMLLALAGISIGLILNAKFGSAAIATRLLIAIPLYIV